jgi:hypothetical protein
MPIINLEANVKNLTVGTGLSLASTTSEVTLSLNNNGLAQILSQILLSSSTVTVNYNPSTGKISFTSTGGSGNSGGGNSGGGGIPPLVITNKNQFTNNSISVAPNQDVFLLANNSADWDNSTTYTIEFPYNFSEPSKHFLFVSYNLPSSSGVEFLTGNLNGIYNLQDHSNQVLMVVITPGAGGAIYGSMSPISPQVIPDDSPN